MCRDKCISKLVVHIDVEIVSHIDSCNVIGRVVGGNFVREILKLICLSWEARFVHVYCETNSSVDPLTSIG